MFKMDNVIRQIEKFINGIEDLGHFIYDTKIIEEYILNVLNRNNKIGFDVSELDTYRLETKDGYTVFCYRVIDDDDEIDDWNKDITHEPVCSYGDFPTICINMKDRKVFWSLTTPDLDE